MPSTWKWAGWGYGGSGASVKRRGEKKCNNRQCTRIAYVSYIVLLLLMSWVGLRHVGLEEAFRMCVLRPVSYSVDDKVRVSGCVHACGVWFLGVRV